MDDWEESLDAQLSDTENIPVGGSRDAGAGKKDDDILGLDKEVKLKTRKPMVKLDAQRLLSKNGLPYLYDNRKKLKYLNKNRSDYNPKDYTTHYTYKNMSMILEFYQLWAHKLFPKARFRDAIMLANRKTSGNSRDVKFFRERLVQQEMEEMFPSSTIEDPSRPLDEDIDAGLSDRDVNEPIAVSGFDLPHTGGEAVADAVVPRGNGLFVGDDDEDNLYTVSTAVSTTAALEEPTVTGPVEHPVQEQSDDAFADDDDDFIAPPQRRHVPNIPMDDEMPDPEEFENDHDDDLEALREMEAV